MKKRLLTLCLLSVFSAFAWGMEWYQKDNSFHFKTGNGKEFIFSPGPYSGLRIGNLNFFLHMVGRSDSGKRTPDLRLQNMKPISVRRLSRNVHSEVVEIVSPVMSLNESKGRVLSITDMGVFTFRMWKDLPVLDVSVTFVRREATPANLCLFLLSNLPAEYDRMGGTRRYPPPEHEVLEARRKTGYNAPEGEVLLVESSQGQAAPFGVIGRSGRCYTSNMLQLFSTRSFAKLTTGQSLTYNVAFAQPQAAGREGLQELRNLAQAMKTLDSLDYLQPAEAYGTSPSQGMFRRFASVKGKILPDGYAARKTTVGFYRDNADIKVHFHCDEPDPSKMILRYHAANDPVWSDDCVELCVAKDWNKRGFIQLIGNVKGARNQNFYNTSMDLSKLVWHLTPQMNQHSWDACFTLTPSCFDSAFMEREGYLPIHVNRESHHTKEYSGWPTEQFNQAECFGRLLPVPYKTYMQKQITVMEQLMTQGGTALQKDFAQLKQALPNLATANTYQLAMADTKLRTFRRRLDFQLKLESCYAILNKIKQNKTADPQLDELLESLEKTIETQDMRLAYNRLRGEILKQISPDLDFMVWRKSPWVYLKSSDYPSVGIDYAKPTELHAGQGEYETAAFAITNFTDQHRAITVSVTDNPASVPVVLRYGFISKSSLGEVNDALPLLTAPLPVPPRKSREVQVTLNTANLKPGRHLITLTFAQASQAVSRQIALTVHPVRLTISDTYNMFFAAQGIMRRINGRQGLYTFFKDMNAHYCRVHQLDGGGIAKPVFDKGGKNLTDYSRKIMEMKDAGDYDYLQDYWGFYAGRDNIKTLTQLFGCPYGSDLFKTRFRIWLKDYFKAIRAAGINTDKLLMYILDETSNDAEMNLVKLAKETVPEINIHITISTTTSMDMLKKAMPYLSSIAPHFYTWRSKKEAWQLFRSHGIKLCPYFNVSPASAKDEPYSVYRRMGWLSKSVGADGAGTWVYFYGDNRWSPVSMNLVQVKNKIIPSSLPNSPAKLAPGEMIVPTKRWEAYREGMEEFYYMGMLEAYMAKHPGTALAANAKKLIDTAVQQVCDADRGWEQDLTTQQKVNFLQLLQTIQNQKH